MTVRSVASLVIVLSSGLLVGCGSKERVLLSAHLEAPELTVTSNSLVTDVAGSFAIELALGDLASDPTTVKLLPFSLQRDGEVLLDPLEFDTEPSFPLDVKVGGSKHVHATIDHPDADADLASALCSGEVQIIGNLEDTLGDHPIAVSSPSFLPDCP